MKFKHVRTWLCAVLSFTLVFGGIFSPTSITAQTDRKPVIISFGKPNIWSLEQAHYLLARMHERSLDLASRTPTDKDLDPNATNASRINVLKSLLEIGAAFEQRPATSATPEASASPVAVPTPDPSRLPKGVIDKLLEDEKFRDELRRDVRLAATTALDNHIQMQYEIIAKQLTLLRDEVGPNERLVFLELPQSIYTTPGKSEEILAQVWWQVANVSFTPVTSNDLVSLRTQHRHYEKEVAGLTAQLSNQSAEITRIEGEIESLEDRKLSVSDDLRNRLATLNADIVNTRQRLARSYEAINDLVEKEDEEVVRRQRAGDAEVLPSDEQGLLRMVRTVDLIPRQSSLNVNDIQDTVKSGALTGVFSFLFGFGAKVNFQRQRELYEQYIHQEIFASGFGKGAREFGWTFGPLPGTKRVAPGIRTTYAVMVIPRNVTELKFTAAGCYFPRKRNAPQDFGDTSNADWRRSDKFNKYQCSTPDAQFIVRVPTTRANSFFVTGVEYRPGAAPGQRLAVSLRGRDFSTQLGVLVDGVPLCPSAGVAQPVLAPRKCASPGPSSSKEISGEFERLNSRQIVLTFRMPDDYKGTPTITVVSPGRAINLDQLLLEINGKVDEQLTKAPFMFGRRSEAGLALTSLDIFRASPQSKRVFAVLSGVKLASNFDPSTVDLRINGVRANLEDKSADLPVEVIKAGPDFYRLEFDLPNSDTIDVSMIQGDEYATKVFPNPLRLNIAEVAVVAFEPKGKGTILTLKIKGSGFGEKPQIKAQGVTEARIIPLSSSEALVELSNPPAAIVLTVTNPDSQISATTLITRPPAKKE